MNEKRISSMLLVTTLIFGMTAALAVNVIAPPPVVVLPDALLIDGTADGVVKNFGPGTLGARTLIGPGVSFTLTGLSSDPDQGTGISDDFPVNQLAGGANKDFGFGDSFSDFCAYTSYEMIFTNPSTVPVWVKLYLNTGWTDNPYGTPQRDTYFEGDWFLAGPGQTVTAVMDFSSTRVFNAADDPEAGNQVPDGTTGVAVFRCDEVSNIGFQVRADMGDLNKLELTVRQGRSVPEAPIGGISTPVNKLAILAPYIAIAIAVAAVVGIVAFKRSKD
jgi:hypothetical protein